MEEAIQSYRDLIVWKKSIRLAVEIYKLTENFPSSEKYGLVSQMRRAAVSIPSNIAEGRYRGSRKEFRHFLLNAFGSGGELETQIEIATLLPFGKKIDFSEADGFIDEVMRMLNTMIKNLKAIT